jgi:hypothetical protein
VYVSEYLFSRKKENTNESVERENSRGKKLIAIKAIFDNL